MRIIIQRVSEASVTIEQKTTRSYPSRTAATSGF
jgi:D-Tyr-tRNAtyr deacylase